MNNRYQIVQSQISCSKCAQSLHSLNTPQNLLHFTFDSNSAHAWDTFIIIPRAYIHVDTETNSYFVIFDWETWAIFNQCMQLKTKALIRLSCYRSNLRLFAYANVTFSDDAAYM